MKNVFSVLVFDFFFLETNVELLTMHSKYIYFYSISKKILTMF